MNHMNYRAEIEGFSFGAWVKQTRHELDLTQEALADQVSCSVEAVKKIEGDRLRPSRQLAQLIVTHLCVPAATQSGFVQWARGGPSPLPSAPGEPSLSTLSTATTAARSAFPTGPRTNLPFVPTPLVGREAETTAITQIFWQTGARLLTLTGPPGTGKTRLAIHTAARLLADCADGVWFVSLAPISDPGLVGAAIAGVLGVKEISDQPLAETLAGYLRDKNLLLVLDNFEQVPDAALLVGQLMALTGQLKIMVTSRSVLQLYGEHEFCVPPLRLPDPTLTDPDLLAQYDAIELFRVRALAATSGFRLTSETAPIVSEICRKLDGLPLAIELAAARVRLLAPETILARLDQRLNVLTGRTRDLPARQQTLRGAIEWSYDLLDAGEQQLFRRLAVFSGGCSPAAIEEVCNPQGLEVEGRRQSSGKAQDVLISAESLLTKSLLNAGPGSARVEGVASESRFWMLETIGEYARDRLRESGEEDELQRRHAIFYMNLAEEAYRNLAGPTQQEWLNRLETEHANLLAALHWAISAVENDPGASEAVEIGLRLAGPLGRFWDWRGDYSQGRTELDRLLSVLALSGTLPPLPNEGTDGMPLAVDEGDARVARATGLVLYWAAVLAGDLGDDAAARELQEQALAIRRRLGDKSAIAESLGSLASVLMTLRDQVHGRSMLEESLALARDVGDHPAIARALRGLGSLASHNGDNPTATALIDEAWAVARETGDKSLIARLLLRRAQNAWVGGDLVVSRSLLQESLHLHRELRDKDGTAEALFWLAFVAYLQSDYSTSKAEAKESLVLYREISGMWGFAACLILFGWLAAVDVERSESAETRKASASREQQIVATESAATPESAERAARLLAAGALLAATKTPGLHAGAQPIHDRSVAVVRATLGDEAFEQASLEGQSMTPEQAIEYALYEKR